ncbi:MAG: response regulator [Candidatus Edwardsbacteria bacterium]|nr:response regulator [Candidatus Edwardsbacteria bacterium]MBU1576603.1 response regulator [Candidatus Edwardsbacteria bacterium]MBU2464390.1 response regulator [Candidatus Edwardsbacteria bacterium]MBU2594946.1 response regulator [Candidatus Edwardsbacteria bacterium]
MRTILVVDDEENIRILYQQDFTANGYKVICAATLDEAKKEFSQNQVDLVVLDLKLTAHDGGLEMLRWMRETNRKIPIIINTAYPAYKTDFSSWLADAYIVKSSNLDELKDNIARLLEENK